MIMPRGSTKKTIRCNKCNMAQRDGMLVCTSCQASNILAHPTVLAVHRWAGTHTATSSCQALSCHAYWSVCHA